MCSDRGTHILNNILSQLLSLLCKHDRCVNFLKTLKGEGDIYIRSNSKVSKRNQMKDILVDWGGGGERGFNGTQLMYFF